MPPLVSVAVPCFNHEKYVKTCIESIIEQSYPNVELIIIDDGSNDKSYEIINELVELCEKRFTRFKFIRQENCGVTETLNRAIDWSEGKYFVGIASDDLMLENRLEKQVKFMEKNRKAVAMFGSYKIIDHLGKTVGINKRKERTLGFKELFLINQIPAAPTQMLRMEALSRIVPIPSKLYIEDWYMWLKMTEKGGYIMETPDFFAKYRIHPTNSSRNLEKIFKSRSLIVNSFTNSKLYERARASISLSSAIDFQPVSKIRSAKFAIEAVKQDRKVVFTKRFFKFFVKFFIPKSLIGRDKTI